MFEAENEKFELCFFIKHKMDGIEENITVFHTVISHMKVNIKIQDKVCVFVELCAFDPVGFAFTL